MAVLGWGVLLMLAACPADAAEVRRWIDTWDGFHTVKVFDWPPPADSEVASWAPKFDFVWNARRDTEWRSGNPNIVLSTYASGLTDNGPFELDLGWWQANHPDWILYECDRVTPVLWASYGAVVLDFTNPAVEEYQFTHYASIAGGKDALAMDNAMLDNTLEAPGGRYGHACGVYDTSGQWVQKFSGRGGPASVEDPAFVDGRITFMRNIRARLQALPQPVLSIPNLDPKVVRFDLARQAALINSVDGILDENGFWSTDWAAGNDFPTKLAFATALQAAGKAWYHIELAFAPVSPSFLQRALAIYFLLKNHAAAMFVGGTSSYDDPTFWYPEYDAVAALGTPCGAYTSANNVYRREYRGGIALVNAEATQARTEPLPSGHRFQDLSGNAMGASVTLSPASGLVLLSTDGPVCAAAALLGDLDGNGKLDLTDVRWSIEMLVKIRPPNLATADLDGNGSLTLADVQALIRLLVGVP